MAESQAIVFLGPSMPLEDARRLLDADYRKPIRRGDLTNIEPGTVVAIIDGVFEQNLAVSPREVHEAVQRGVVVFGGASMGALRAAEVPGVIGTGRIFEWYRDEFIMRDDEVALLFAEDSGRALTVPMVNVRFAAERLSRLGTIDAATAGLLVSTALNIPYKERTYRAIFKAAGIPSRSETDDLIQMLEQHDLKYRDAQAVLEALDRHLRNRNGDAPKSTGLPVNGKHASADRPAEQLDNAPGRALIWESGDSVSHGELYQFLAFTGKVTGYVRALRQRFIHSVEQPAQAPGQDVSAQGEFNAAARRWGWMSPEEAKVTMADLGLELEHIAEECTEAGRAGREVAALLRAGVPEFRFALIANLFLDGLALKREVMRLGSLHALARQAGDEVSPEDLNDAETVLCKANGEFSFARLREKWAATGFAAEGPQDAFVQLVASARHAARKWISISKASRGAAAPEGSISGFDLGPCPKPPGEARFCLAGSEVEAQARRIGQRIGVTRISMIGELADLAGIHVSQAARPGNAWSSSYGSGKSRTKAGAIAGSIMEETEKWAQEQFQPEDWLTRCYAEVRTTGDFIDPATLDLPYDSVYRPELPLSWYPCVDLLSTRQVYVPLDALQMNRRKHDIYFTARGARKHLATNGLGCGFSREECTLHALCEYVERHAQRMAELLLSNPGVLGPHPFRFVDLMTTSPAIQETVQKLSRTVATIRVLDITSEVRIPTFVAGITRELQRAEGFGAHPDPNTAIEMALLEAAQTIASEIAGGREDLTIHARSLGRHERPRPVSVESAWFWLDPDPDYKSVSEIDGFASADVYEDLTWCLDRVRAAGLAHALVVDLTRPEITPAHVVRVIVPGLETNNPFYTGWRARLLLLRDLLPNWQYALR